MTGQNAMKAQDAKKAAKAIYQRVRRARLREAIVAKAAEHTGARKVRVWRGSVATEREHPRVAAERGMIMAYKAASDKAMKARTVMKAKAAEHQGDSD